MIKTVYDRLAAMREAGGDALDIIVEMHSNTDTLAAIRSDRRWKTCVFSTTKSPRIL